MINLMNRKASLSIILVCLIIITGCGNTNELYNLRPKSVEEQQTIRDSWFPVKSFECQLIVDSFSLLTAAVGNDSLENLSQNMDQIEERLDSAGRATSTALLNLANTTSEESIRAWALKAVPIFSGFGDLIVSDVNSLASEEMLQYLSDLSKLVEDVPYACRS
jgi:hypothetical protein